MCALVPERGAHRISGLFSRMFKMRLRAGVADDTPPFVCRLGMDVCCCSSFQEDMHACGSVWGRVVGLNSKATSFADSIDKMFGVSSPKSHTSLDSCMHVCVCFSCVHGHYCAVAVLCHVIQAMLGE